jgi:hypothetical protein
MRSPDKNGFLVIIYMHNFLELLTRMESENLPNNFNLTKQFVENYTDCFEWLTNNNN